MSDDLKDDYSGATKGVFAAVGVMLLAVGGEMIAEKEGLRVGLGSFLVLLGCLFFYAAAFWRTARKALSADAQLVIARVCGKLRDLGADLISFVSNIDIISFRGAT